MSDNIEAIGKWLAVTACIVMGGLCILSGKPDYASGFATGAVALVVLA